MIRADTGLWHKHVEYWQEKAIALLLLPKGLHYWRLFVRATIGFPADQALRCTAP